MSNSQTPEPGTERITRSSVRNPRRRQRPSDGDSLKTAPRRKRSKLSEDSYAPTRESVEHGDAAFPNNHHTHAMNGHAGGRKESTPAMSIDMDLPVRGSKKTGTVRRAMKGDGATVLAMNKFYSVKLLPSTPQELRKPGVEFRGSLVPEQHLALAITSEKAYIWDYTSHTPSNSARVFDVPFAARGDEGLPFGALVQGSAGSYDVGLVLLAAHGGKVVFYESIERAASLGLFHERRTGVEGMLAGVYTGESVTDIAPAEHAGFVVALSSGRLLQMTLRDTQGKVRISTQFLQSIDPASRGLFGTIKRFAGLVNKNVTALRTRSLGTRGQMQAIALTDTGAIETWDLDWSGRSEPRGTVDFRDAMMMELRSLISAEMQARVDHLKCLDLAIRDKPAAARGDEIATLGTEQPIDLWLLLSVGAADMKEYYIGEMTISGANVGITRLMPLKSYHDSGNTNATTITPRLLVPKPGHTAFVAFENAVVLAATADPTASDPDPNAQLHEASYIDPEAFEDAIFLRAATNVAFLDACEEPSKAGHASCLMFVKGTGLVRFAATDPAGDVERTRIPVKSKIEQAVFHGPILQADNILDLGRKTEVAYSLEEIEEATLAISDEVLRSASAFLSRSPTNIASHLDHKARALKALVAHVSRNYPVFSRAAMWRLLWDAERVAAAQNLRQACEEDKTASSGGTKIARVLDELCNSAATQNSWNVASGEDAVQYFFVRHLDKMSWLLVHTRSFIDSTRETPPEAQRILTTVEGADEMWLRIIETALVFRTDNAISYGVQSEVSDEGIPTDMAEHADLAQSWLSTGDMLKAVVKVCTWSRELAKEYYEQVEAEPEIEAHCRTIVAYNPRLVQLCCLIYQEHIDWIVSRPSTKDRDLAEKLIESFKAERYRQFRALEGVAQADAGMKLAEKYRDMHTLTDLVVAESQYALETLATTHDEQERKACEDVIADSILRIGKYFDRFGDEWANAFFDEAFSGSRAGAMLGESQKYWGDALTQYLRSDPTRAKLCWMNDVTAKKDYAHAGDVLAGTAVDQEEVLWAKKVELSISKLACLAALEDDSPAHDKAKQDELVARDENHLRIVKVQEDLYGHLLPDTVRGIDHDAEVELVMRKFGSHTDQHYVALNQLLGVGVDRVLDHKALSAEELIDVLTLMDTASSEKPQTSNLQDNQFYQALVVLDAAAAGMPQARFEVLLQLIWKRCFVAEDWVAINNKQINGKDHEAWNQTRQGAVWRTIYHIHDQQLLLHAKKSGVRILAPSECLGAGCREEDLAWRFAGNGDLMDPMLKDNRLQDDLLQSYTTDRRLDEWVSGVEKSVLKCIETEAARAGEDRERERQIESEME